MAVVVLMMAVQLVRVWSSAPLNSIWAEDGYIFLADALRWGFFHALTTPYDGYLNTLSRLVAEPVSLLPVKWFAPAMALCGAAIVTGCAFVVWRASAAHIENRYLRGTLVAMMVLLPNIGIEMVDDVTYTIWFLSVRQLLDTAVATGHHGGGRRSGCPPVAHRAQQRRSSCCWCHSGCCGQWPFAIDATR